MSKRKTPARLEAAAARLVTDELIKAIEACGLTDTELAGRAGVHASLVGRFKRRERGILLDSAARIAACLGLRLVAIKSKRTSAEPEPALLLPVPEMIAILGAREINPSEVACGL